MKPSSAKAKGRRLQQWVRDRIVGAFAPHLDWDDVRSASTSTGGEDVPMSPKARGFFPFSIECKNTERLNIWKALKQATANADWHTPLLVFSRNREEVYAVLRFEDLLATYKRLHRAEDELGQLREAIVNYTREEQPG